jgi:hypothetical protein
VEKIVNHNLSDPQSHDKTVHGYKPVMLYQVKWEGYEELTWEPETSFEDKAVLDEYWALQEDMKKKQKKKKKKKKKQQQEGQKKQTQLTLFAVV